MSVLLSDKAYRRIHQMLVSRELKVGQKISESSLAKELGIGSRTPVREAIHRLRNDGLLVQIANSGTFVATPNRRQLVEMYEVRLALETMLVAKATRMIRPRQIVQLQAHVDEMRRVVRAFRDTGQDCMSVPEQQAFLAADLAFHELIIEAGQNESASKILSDVLLRHRAFGLESHRRDLHHVAWTWLYHARVLSAMRRRNAGAAMRMLRRHIRFSMREALFVIDSGVLPQQAPRQPRSTSIRPEAAL